MEWPDYQVGRRAPRRDQGGCGKPGHACGVPTAIGSACDASERDSLGSEHSAGARRGRIAYGLQIRRNLAGQHFNEARPEHPDRLAGIGNGLECHRQPSLIHRALRDNPIESIECCKVESLAEHEYIADDVSAAAYIRFVMTA